MSSRDDIEIREQLDIISHNTADARIDEVKARTRLSSEPQHTTFPDNQLWMAVSLHRIAEALEYLQALVKDEVLPTLEVISGERKKGR